VVWGQLAFLPSNFSNKWLSIRLNLEKAIQREKALSNQTNENKRDETIKDLDELESLIQKHAKEAEAEILSEVGLHPIVLEIWRKKNKAGD